MSVFPVASIELAITEPLIVPFPFISTKALGAYMALTLASVFPPILTSLPPVISRLSSAEILVLLHYIGNNIKFQHNILKIYIFGI